MRKRTLITVALVLCLLFEMLSPALPVRAAGNGTMDGAQTIEAGQTVTATMEPNGAYYYKISAVPGGKFLTVTGDTPELKVSFLDSAGNTLNRISADGEGLTVTTVETGVYYLLFNAVNLTVAKAVAFTVFVEDNDPYEPNDSTAEAREIRWGEPVVFTLGGNDRDWFCVDVEKAGQTIVLTPTTDNMVFTVRDLQANTLSPSGGRVNYFATWTRGRHYISPSIWHDGIGTVQGEFTATLLDNDSREPNNSMAEAIELTAGQTVENIITNPGDKDWFKIRVRTGQVVTAQLSNPAGSVAFYDAAGGYISSIGYEDKAAFTAPTEGWYYVVCSSGGYEGNVTASLTVTLTDNDSYEPNNTAGAAAQLTSGQSAQTVLGTGDEDWFRVHVGAGQFLTVGVEADCDADTAIYADAGETLVKSGSTAGFSATLRAEKEGDYYIRVMSRGGRGGRAVVTATLTDNDGYEPNNAPETAQKIEAGTPVELALGAGDEDWLRIDTERAGQIIQAEARGTDVGLALYSADGRTQLVSGRGTDPSVSVITGEAGAYYIRCWSGDAIVRAEVTVTLRNNDSHEPNNTEETAAQLPAGQAVTVMLAPNDVDWFYVTTGEAGQDICLDIGGFDYANQGRFSLEFDGAVNTTVDGNGRLWLHAAQAGKHTLRLSGGEVKTAGGSYAMGFLPLTITAAAVSGEAAELLGNDTAENAVALTPGTDAAFSLGGWGDEDWFSFAVTNAGEEAAVYTLQFLGLAADESDQLVYEVYAPDGTKIVSATRVSARYAAAVSCDQQGTYKVRVTSRNESGSGYLDISRSQLRIRVSPGGGDPYESNDTWLTAMPVQTGQRIGHVLADTADRDWFCFTAEEDDMSFLLERDQNGSAALYRAEDLARSGENAQPLSTAAACKLERAGVYYLRLSAGAAYVSETQRTFTVTVTAHGGEENNDIWGAAKPLYDGALRSFDIAGGNDDDWFSVAVPQGTDTLSLVIANPGSSVSFKIYREEELRRSAGAAAAVHSDSIGNGQKSVTLPVQPETYYIWISGSSRTVGASVTVRLLNGGADRENAIALARGVWSQPTAAGCWYSLGQLESGDVVRYSRDGGGGEAKVYLYNSADAGYRAQSAYANYGFNIPADGVYYLYVDPAGGVDGSGELCQSRIRYFVGEGDYATGLEGPEEMTLFVGESRFAEVMTTPYAAKGGTARVYSTTTNRAVALFDERTGYVTALGAGTAQITFEINCNGQFLSKTVTVTVVEPTAATDVAIEGAPESMTVGESAQLTAVLSPEEAAEKARWSSSDPNVLYVSPGGRLVAVGAGEAVIRAAVAAAEDSVRVTVVPDQTQEPANRLTLDRYSLTLYMGEESETLTAEVLPLGTAVTWTSSNPGVAAVDGGTVSAVSAGVSVVTAQAGDLSAGCVVTVLPERIRVTGVSFTEQSLQLLMGESAPLTAVVEPQNATTKTLLWSSVDERVATVSAAGVVTAVAVGETTVRAVSLDGGFTAEITVTVTAQPRLGDINGDGWVDSGDALLALQVAVGRRQLTDEQERWADVNRDGRVDAGDAIRILRYDARLIDSLE